ncbi:hypothetical protein, partial [Lonsdalea populi]|uniref:hypothetical protein n=1 Tax=Lonsdalea populi TaxID=1172565 RepID=UPI001C661409
MPTPQHAAEHPGKCADTCVLFTHSEYLVIRSRHQRFIASRITGALYTINSPLTPTLLALLRPRL